MSQFTRGPGRILAWAAPAAIALSLAGCGVNDIPTKEETAKAKWADVQSAYQRRADLIPNLVRTVEAYAKQDIQITFNKTPEEAQEWMASEIKTWKTNLDILKLDLDK